VSQDVGFRINSNSPRSVSEQRDFECSPGQEYANVLASTPQSEPHSTDGARGRTDGHEPKAPDPFVYAGEPSEDMDDEVVFKGSQPLKRRVKSGVYRTVKSVTLDRTRPDKAGRKPDEGVREENLC